MLRSYFLLASLSIVGCSVHTPPLYRPGDLVVPASPNASSDTTAPLGLVTRVYPNGDEWYCAVAYPEWSHDLSEASLTRVGHLEWQDLRQFCNKPEAAVKK